MATLVEVQQDAIGALEGWMTGYTDRRPQEKVILMGGGNDNSIVVDYYCDWTKTRETFRVTISVEELFGDDEDQEV